MTALVAASFVAALAGSPHCIGMCGGLSLAASTSRAGAVAWNLGRITTYAALGALAAGFGEALPGTGRVAAVIAALLLVWFAGGIAGVFPPLHVALPGIAPLSARLLRRADLGSRLVLGLLSGLLPCGLVYSALAVPIASGAPIAGAVAMATFGLGTVPAMAGAAAGLRRLLGTGRWGRRALGGAVLAAGLFAIATRQPAADGSARCHVPKPEAASMAPR